MELLKGLTNKIVNATSDGNAGILKQFEIIGSTSQPAHVGFQCGHHALWTVAEAKEKQEPKREVSIFSCPFSAVAERCDLASTSNVPYASMSTSQKEEVKKFVKTVFDRLKVGPQALAKIRHPDVLRVIVPVFEEGTGSQRRLVFVTERVLCTLDTLLRAEAPARSGSSGGTGGGSSRGLTATARMACSINRLEALYRLHRLARTLNFLHLQANLVALNLNPSGIFLTPSGEWKIGDLTFSVPPIAVAQSCYPHVMAPIGSSGGSQSSSAALPRFEVNPANGRWINPLEVFGLDYVAPEVVAVCALSSSKYSNSNSGGGGSGGGSDPNFSFFDQQASARAAGGSSGGLTSSTVNPLELAFRVDAFSFGLVLHEVLSRWATAPSSSYPAIGSFGSSVTKPVLRCAGELAVYWRQLSDIRSTCCQQALRFAAREAADRPTIAQVVGFLDPTLSALEVQMLEQLESVNCLSDEGKKLNLFRTLVGCVDQLGENLLCGMVLPVILSARQGDPLGLDHLVIPTVVQACKGFGGKWSEGSKRSTAGEGWGQGKDDGSTMGTDDGWVSVSSAGDGAEEDRVLRFLTNALVKDLLVIRSSSAADSSPNPGNESMVPSVVDPRARLHLLQHFKLLKPFLTHDDTELALSNDKSALPAGSKTGAGVGAATPWTDSSIGLAEPIPLLHERASVGLTFLGYCLSQVSAVGAAPTPGAGIGTGTSAGSGADLGGSSMASDIVGAALQEIPQWTGIIPIVGHEVWSKQILVPLVRYSNPELALRSSDQNALRLNLEFVRCCAGVSHTMKLNEVSVLMARCPEWLKLILDHCSNRMLPDDQVEGLVQPFFDVLFTFVTEVSATSGSAGIAGGRGGTEKRRGSAQPPPKPCPAVTSDLLATKLLPGLVVLLTTPLMTQRKQVADIVIRATQTCVAPGTARNDAAVQNQSQQLRGAPSSGSNSLAPLPSAFKESEAFQPKSASQQLPTHEANDFFSGDSTGSSQSGVGASGWSKGPMQLGSGSAVSSGSNAPPRRSGRGTGQAQSSGTTGPPAPVTTQATVNEVFGF